MSELLKTAWRLLTGLFAQIHVRSIVRTTFELLVGTKRKVIRAIRRFVLFLANISPKGAELPEADDCNNLSSVKRRGNWKIKRQKLPHYLIRDAGIDIDAVANEMIGECRKREDCSVAWAGEKTNIPQKSRPLRIIHTLMKGHIGHTDINLRCDGNDLYVKFESKPWTLISYLRMLCYLACFLTLFFTVFYLYFIVSGSKRSMFKDYADKYSEIEGNGPAGSAFMSSQLNNGYYTINWSKFYGLLEEDPSFRVEDIETLILVAISTDPTPGGGFLFLPEIGIWGVGIRCELSEEERVRLANKLPQVKSGFDELQEFLVKANMYGLLVDGQKYANAYAINAIAGTPEYLSWLMDRYLENEFGREYYRTFHLRDSEIIAHFKRPLAETRYSSDTSIDCKGFIERCFYRWNPEYTQSVINALEKSTNYTKPASFWDIARKDPKIAVWNLGWPFAITGAITSGLMFLLPQHLLRYPCNWLGWPAPDEYENMLIQRDTIIEKEMSEILARNGIYENQIIKIEQ